MPITIRHTAPPADLAPYVERFWRITSDRSTTLRVIPDGCWDIVINAGEPAEFVGPMTSAFMVPLAAGAPHHGVRFKAGTYFVPLETTMAQRLDVSIKLSELVNVTVAASDSRQSLEELVAVFIKQNWLQQDVTVQTIMVRLNDPQQSALLDLYRELGVSAATVERKFKKYVGLTPRSVRRISRQLAVNEELLAWEFPQLGALAADFGYVDQAHMTHELRLLSGAPPSRLRREYDDYVQDTSLAPADTDIIKDKELL